MTDDRRGGGPRRASRSTSAGKSQRQRELKQAPVNGHRAARRNDTRSHIRPAVSATERVDGLNLIGPGRDEELTGERSEGGTPPATDLEREIVACLAAAGALAPVADADDVPTDPAEIEALEREHDAWLATQTEPLGLTQAVLADRE